MYLFSFVFLAKCVKNLHKTFLFLEHGKFEILIKSHFCFTQFRIYEHDILFRKEQLECVWIRGISIFFFNPHFSHHHSLFIQVITADRTLVCWFNHSMKNNKSAPIGAWKCNFPRLKEIMTVQPINRQTNQQTVIRVYGNLHFQLEN